ncbi:hypothetical protein HHI36_015595, partial [Cryptolaemus montrouzieri]
MIQKKQNERCYGVKINEYSIENVTEFRYLGIVIDNNLKFTKYADYICGKVSKK